MGLIVCPDCEKEISDQALNCPNCGRPMKKTEEKEKPSVNISIVRSKGGVFEGLGTLLIIVGIFLVIYGASTNASGKIGTGLIAGFLGFIIFLIGRFM